MKEPHLNRQLTLENAVQSPDGSGGLTVTWVQLGTVWAEFQSATASEKTGYAAPVARALYRAILRAAPVGSPRRPQPGQRARIGTRIFEIDAVSEYDRDARFLRCILKEETVS
jgi:head-tail adaptor